MQVSVCAIPEREASCRLLEGLWGGGRSFYSNLSIFATDFKALK